MLNFRYKLTGVFALAAGATVSSPAASQSAISDTTLSALIERFAPVADELASETDQYKFDAASMRHSEDGEAITAELVAEAEAQDNRPTASVVAETRRDRETIAILEGTENFKEALPLQERILKVYEEQLGKDHSSTFGQVQKLGSLYMEAGENDRAIPVLKRALDGHESLLGPLDPATIDSLEALGKAFARQGDDNAIACFRLAFARKGMVYGPDGRQTILAAYNLGLVLHSLGQPAEALPCFEQTASFAKPGTVLQKEAAANARRCRMEIQEDQE